MKWVITANTNQCCIYDFEAHELHLIKEWHHPENKMRNSEIATDRPGRNGSGAFTPESNPEDVYVDNFAREIATELDKGRNKHSFEQLIVIMPPQMEGLLSKHLNKSVKDLIKITIHKNIMHLSEKELVEVIDGHRFQK